MLSKKTVGRLLVIVVLVSGSVALLSGAASAENAEGAGNVAGQPRADVTNASAIPTLDSVIARQSRLVGLTPDARAKLAAASRELFARMNRPTPRDVRKKTPLDHARDIVASPGYASITASTGGDVEGAVGLVLAEAAKDAQSELDTIMAQMQASNSAKQKLRGLVGTMVRLGITSSKDLLLADGGKSDAAGELTLPQIGSLVPVIDRLVALDLALSNLLKKVSDTQSAIVSNLK